MSASQAVLRLRVTFGIEWPLCYASVLDLGRLWERLLRRAQAPLAYSSGYSPHPRLTFAAALPVGYTSEAEVLDILLRREVQAENLLEASRAQAPLGLGILSAHPVPLPAPAISALMREAHYRVLLRGSRAEDLRMAVQTFLARTAIPRERRQGTKVRKYDLRPLVLGLCVIDDMLLGMTLACGPQGSGRPEEVIDEMGLPIADFEIRRVALVWDGGQSGEPIHVEGRGS